MEQIYKFNDYIYESPDGGRTVYQRKFGEQDRQLVAQNMSSRLDPMDALKYNISYGEFIDILKIAETNSTLKDCLDKLLSTFNLLKEHD